MEGGLYSEKFIARASEFVVTPLLVGPVCLISQGRLEKPVCPCIDRRDECKKNWGRGSRLRMILK